MVDACTRILVNNTEDRAVSLQLLGFLLCDPPIGGRIMHYTRPSVRAYVCLVNSKTENHTTFKLI